ncbi:MAG: cytochrome d ubiquinol oxidase subunit II, partial [Gemmatimonadaceae bacterium]|nr:cytochrome d ubiquinol oxidase subunit II [Gemmatimonadaceae bacterium]
MNTGIDLPDLLAGVMVLALHVYTLLGGADFGGGLWDLFARGPRQQAQRDLVADAIGPIWEANHVWLILVVVMLFTCFPAAFASYAIALHIPLTLMLVGVVLRGSAFTFRSYDSRRDAVQRRWGLVFSIASLVTPVLLGVALGAALSGAVGASVTAPTAFGRFVAPWLGPFPWAVGAFVLILFAYLAAVYLTVEASEPALREDFRARALASGVALFVAGGLVFLLARRHAPFLWNGLLASPRAIPVHLSAAASAALAGWALWHRRYALARWAAIFEASAIVWAWAWVQWPYFVPPDRTIDDLAAPAATLRLVAIGLAAGFVILVPSFWVLCRIFKRRPRP